ncbi:MAG TPA: SRPBCC family protein [Bryobacteraceae bacterium]|nr:SRPBCC family protein [Bryobacteraceae bacterium]
MRIFDSKVHAVCAAGIVCLARIASAQAPAPAPLAIPNPNYVSIPMEITVNRPAEEVWKRVGKYCDIGEWLQVPCTIVSGKDGEFGAVRSIGNEVLVGKTELSYTYTQPVRVGQPYILYHGTLEARPLTPTTSKLIYTLVYDNSTLADDAAREQDRMRRTAQFTRALQNMKTLAEGGVLPPPPARGGQKGGAPKQ